MPKLEKIVVNRRSGTFVQNFKFFDSSYFELTAIVMQKAIKNKSNQSIAGFKIRKEITIRMKITIRSERIFAFLDRITNFAFPRIRDFQGLNKNSHISILKQEKFVDEIYTANLDVVFNKNMYDMICQEESSGSGISSRMRV